MIRDRLAAINAETEPLWAAQGLAPQLICEAWTAESFGEAIKEAIAAGTDWTSTAEHLACAMSLRLSRPDAADDATGGGA